MDGQDDNGLDFSAIIIELGIDKMSPDEQKEVLQDILKTANIRATKRITASLTDEQRAEMERLVENDELQRSQEVLLKFVPKEEQLRIYQEALDSVKEDIKHEMSTSQVDG